MLWGWSHLFWTLFLQCTRFSCISAFTTCLIEQTLIRCPCLFQVVEILIFIVRITDSYGITFQAYLAVVRDICTHFCLLCIPSYFLGTFAQITVSVYYLWSSSCPVHFPVALLLNSPVHNKKECVISGDLEPNLWLKMNTEPKCAYATPGVCFTIGLPLPPPPPPPLIVDEENNKNVTFYIICNLWHLGKAKPCQS